MQCIACKVPSSDIVQNYTEKLYSSLFQRLQGCLHHTEMVYPEEKEEQIYELSFDYDAPRYSV